MNLDEATQTLAAGGLELRRDSVERLVERTEGWPVGFYLAGLSLSRKERGRRRDRRLPRR